ncbi:helix-turn-helix transcriptional regulator [Boseongicola sp. H5]|uniref:helix-turn-helix transcriptional regulator n=1 Tax=Boseongicola sp. H5 TaxID=2763261 RepID=UPI001D09AF9E|nr:helix-turn-helix transcriptional regulator [Boseongicola sp. H5]
MSTEFALDLRLARRKSGLTLRDTAHLLNVHPTTLSALEHGKRLPSVEQVCLLALIYGRSFQSLFNEVTKGAKQSLQAQLPSLPEPGTRWLGKIQREKTLTRLSSRLSDSDVADGGA